MSFSGSCYCGKVKYEADGDALMKIQCHCRECTYITGGAANLTDLAHSFCSGFFSLVCILPI